MIQLEQLQFAAANITTDALINSGLVDRNILISKSPLCFDVKTVFKLYD